MKDICERLRNAIDNSKFTQLEIAKTLNISKDTISNYINNKSIPRLDILLNICNLIEIPIQDIVYGFNKNDFDEIILRKLNNLTNEQRKEIIGHIEYLENKNNQMSYISVNIPNSDTKINNSG